MELKKTSWSRDTSGRDARTWYSPIAETMTLAPRIALGPRSTFTSARTETGPARGEPRRLPGAEVDAARRAALPCRRRVAREDSARATRPGGDDPRVARASRANAHPASEAMATRIAARRG